MNREDGCEKTDISTPESKGEIIDSVQLTTENLSQYFGNHPQAKVPDSESTESACTSEFADSDVPTVEPSEPFTKNEISLNTEKLVGSLTETTVSSKPIEQPFNVSQPILNTGKPPEQYFAHTNQSTDKIVDNSVETAHQTFNIDKPLEQTDISIEKSLGKSIETGQASSNPHKAFESPLQIECATIHTVEHLEPTLHTEYPSLNTVEGLKQTSFNTDACQKSSVETVNTSDNTHETVSNLNEELFSPLCIGEVILPSSSDPTNKKVEKEENKVMEVDTTEADGLEDLISEGDVIMVDMSNEMPNVGVVEEVLAEDIQQQTDGNVDFEGFLENK